MEAVTGQVGIELAPIDFSLDLQIENVALIDRDSGTMDIAGVNHAFTQGVLNINDLAILNLHETLWGTPLFDSSDNLIGVQAKPVEIDIVSFGSDVPFLALRNKTALVISGPDMRMTIDEVRIGAITLQTTPTSVTGAFDNLLTGTYYYNSTSPTGGTNELIGLKLQGLSLNVWAYPREIGTLGMISTYKEYYAKDGTHTSGGSTVSHTAGDAIYGKHRAQLIIGAH
jgi:hypothetical protein